jgi:large conductance mechanosensitive channel
VSLQGFKNFITRGNLVELAVAFVIGLAFATLLRAFISDLITPILAAFGGQPIFSELNFTINGSTFLYGDFLNALITFVATAAIIYYFVVVPYSRLTALRESEAAAESETRDCPFCVSEIPVQATRCPHCTSQVPAASPTLSS